MMYHEALAAFRRDTLPQVRKRYGTRDKVAVRTAWCDYVDTLHRERQITDKQAQAWDNPFP